MDTIVLILILALLVFICISDLKSRVIPNNYLILCGLSVVLYCFISDSHSNLLWVLPSLIFGIMLWLFGVWGAGDAKLLALLAPLVKPHLYIHSILIILIWGALTAIVMTVGSKLLKRNKPNTIAYGVPISIGCVVGMVLSAVGV